jgi:hypothetical protein
MYHDLSIRGLVSALNLTLVSSAYLGFTLKEQQAASTRKMDQEVSLILQMISFVSLLACVQVHYPRLYLLLAHFS